MNSCSLIKITLGKSAQLHCNRSRSKSLKDQTQVRKEINQAFLELKKEVSDKSSKFPSLLLCFWKDWWRLWKQLFVVFQELLLETSDKSSWTAVNLKSQRTLSTETILSNSYQLKSQSKLKLFKWCSLTLQIWPMRIFLKWDSLFNCWNKSIEPNKFTWIN